MVPLPSWPTALAALAMWCTWWIADQVQPQIWGLTLGPIALALIARQVTFPLVNIARSAAARQQFRQSPGATAFALIAAIGLPLLALFLEDERLAQIAFTIFVAAMGLAQLFVLTYWPQDLGRISGSFGTRGETREGVHLILGLSQLLLALGGAALIGMGAEAAWVALMSVGQVIFKFLVYWIVVLWILSRDEGTT
ncbi:MAG: hypothetical protein AAGL89_12460 [Pseudomonadota bacterium]